MGSQVCYKQNSAVLCSLFDQVATRGRCLSRRKKIVQPRIVVETISSVLFVSMSFSEDQLCPPGGVSVQKKASGMADVIVIHMCDHPYPHTAVRSGLRGWPCYSRSLAAFEGLRGQDGFRGVETGL